MFIPFGLKINTNKNNFATDHRIEKAKLRSEDVVFA